MEMGSSSNSECDGLNETELDDFKETFYKLFKYGELKLRGSNGEFRCPFSAAYHEEELNYCDYIHLLLHAIREVDSSTGKRRAKHFAMARYLSIDLADDVKAEAQQPSSKRRRLDEDITKEEALEKVRQLERELDEKTDQINELITKQRLSNDELQGARREIIKRLLKEDDASLQDLKKEWGLVMHDAAVVALNDLREYNPSGCHGVPELWNFKEDRKAPLDEVISFILEAVKELPTNKMGSTSDVNNSRITEHRERGSNDSRINNSDEESGIRESEIFVHKDRIYKLLKACTYKVRGPNGQLRCPFCFVEEEQDHSYLFRHALMVAESSSESAEQRANHSALVRYLVVDLPADAEPPLQCTRTSPTSRNLWEINAPEERCRHEDDKTKKGALEKLLNEEKDTQLPFQNLLARERLSDDELRGARNEAMKIGEIDVNAFKRAYRKRFPHGEADIRAIAECSKWEEKLKNSQWHPVQTVEDYMGNHQRVVVDDDLQGLKDEWGDEVYNAVVAALDDHRRDNPSGGNTAGKHIWRKASASTSSKN